MKRVYVVDTGYLVELFAVPGKSSPPATTAVRARFADAIQHDARLVVPTGVLYETANHIALVGHGGVRIRIARKLFETVDASLAVEREGPWTITPAEPHGDLLANLRLFATQHATRGIGLTDTQVVATARRWRARYGGMADYAVHIWTRDHGLKAMEPDPEPDPFV